MRMRVHEARRQCRVAKVDHFRVSRNRDVRSDIDNLIALHDDDAVLRESTRFTIEQPRRF